ncbi:MAG: MFS transporter [Candidatus Latescibacteria bacterium]|nr:MFS transporter [Candidatus Latescibacterota bacterium]
MASSPEEGLTREERRRAETQGHISLFLCGILFGLTGVGTTSAVFLTCCAQELGASTFQFSVIPALWGLSCFPIFFVALWVSRVRRVKALCAGALAGTAATGLAFCGVLFLPFPAGAMKVWALLAVALAGHFISNIYYAGWFAWMPHFVRQGRMGQFQSIRLLVVMAATMLSHTFGGFFLERFPGTAGFVGLFATGTLAGLLGLLPIAWIPEPVHVPPASRGVRDAFRAVAGCRDLMRFFTFVFIWNFMMMFAGVFPTVFMRKTLLIPYGDLGVYTALAPAGTLCAALVWGRLTDRYGGKPIVRIAVIGMIGIPFLWALNAPGRVTALPFAQFSAGVFQSAFWVSWLPLLYSVSPPGLQGMAATVSFTAWGVPGVVSPFLGGQVVERLSGVHFRLLGVDMGSIHLLFLIQCLGFLLCLLALRLIPASEQSREGPGPGRPKGGMAGAG